MNGWVEAPPPRKGVGCFARGCLILVVFGTVLAVACFAGLYWGLQRHSAVVHGIFWLAKTHSIAETPAPVPEFGFGRANSIRPGTVAGFRTEKACWSASRNRTDGGRC